MAPVPPHDALTTDAGPLALEGALRPAFAVDAAARVVWAGPLARRLLDAGGLEDASAATLARLAASGAATMARLRFGALGRAAPLVVQTRPLRLEDGQAVIVVEALSEIDPATERALVEPVEDVEEDEPKAAAETASADEVVSEHVDTEEIAADDAEDDRPQDAPYEDVSAAESARSDDVVADATPDAQDDAAPSDLVEEREPEAADVASDGVHEAIPVVAVAETREAPAAAIPAEEVLDGSWRAPDDAELAALRFVFEIDREERLAFLSPDLEAAVGPSAGRALGRPWRETEAALGLDPEGAVARALDGGAGWSDLAVSWPMPDGRRMPLRLSALPLFDAGRAPAGFRGFGRAGGSPEAIAAPPSAPLDTEEIEDASLAPSAVSAEAAPEAVEPDEAVVTDPPPVARLLGRNVVSLRETAPPILSMSEESAFDEIARRLRDVGVRTSSSPYDHPDAPAPSREPWTINDVEARVAEGASADELLRLLDRLPVGALALKGGQVVYANRATLDLLGHADLTSLGDRDAHTLFAEPLPRGDDGAPSTLRLLAHDGVEVEAEAKLSAILWEGEPATLVSLKRAEGAVAAARDAIEREKETAAILDTATDGVLTLDGAGRILSANRSAEALFGFEARDVIGALFTLSLAPGSRRIAFDYLDRLRNDGVAAVMNDGREVLGLVRQGGAIPLYMTIGRIGAHESDRFCAVLRDITPWKKAEEELLAAKREAERASRQKSEFLTKVSHEIRTPLNAIIGFAEVMMEERFGPVGSPRYKDYLRDIHVSGGHLVGLVNDLVDIARIESGGIKLDPTPVDLNEIAAQAAALLQPQAGRDHVIIRASLARGLPAVMADRRSVRQIMTTLTANAVKLSRAGGQVIVATAITDAGQAVIRVRDAGPGMTRQEIARALEPFRPLGEGGEGGSLALPLAKALAEANDAALTLSSEPGHGTIAEVVFPAARVMAG